MGSQIRQEEIKVITYGDEYPLSYKQRTQDFTRKRKIRCGEVVWYTVGRYGISQSAEIRRYCKAKGVERMSATAMHNQRMKMKPSGFWALNHLYLKSFYNAEDVELKTYKGYLLIGIDGSSLTLPTTEELRKVYGETQGKAGDKKTAMATLSTSYDVLNEMIIDSTVEEYMSAERTLALLHIERHKDILRGKKNIVIMDRGYGGIGMYAELSRQQQRFIIRVKKRDLKRYKEKMRSEDEEVEIEYTKEMMSRQRKEIAEYMKEKQKETIRITKIILENSEEEEWLISNIEKEKLTKEELKEVYGKRWGIETAYRRLKNQMKLEQFSGVRKELIEQDIYATIFAMSMIEDTIQEAEKEMREEKKESKGEVKVNKNQAIGIWKEGMIECFKGEDNEKERKRLKEINKEIKRYITVIREGRRYERKKSKKPRKYHQNQKTAY